MLNVISALGVVSFALTALPWTWLNDFFGPCIVLVCGSLQLLGGYLPIYFFLNGNIPINTAGLTFAYIAVGSGSRAAYQAM
jgi:hypothetical protein